MNKINLQLLTDECIPKDLVESLKTAGFEVLMAVEAGLGGKTDDEVYEYAVNHNLSLVTFDRGFGQIYKYDFSQSPGIVIILIKGMSREQILAIPIAFLKNLASIKNKLVIIGRTKVRMIEK